MRNHSATGHHQEHERLRALLAFVVVCSTMRQTDIRSPLERQENWVLLYLIPFRLSV
jgi:hypothetical protein